MVYKLTWRVPPRAINQLINFMSTYMSSLSNHPFAPCMGEFFHALLPELYCRDKMVVVSRIVAMERTSLQHATFEIHAY